MNFMLTSVSLTPSIPMGEMLRQDQVCIHSGFVLQVRNSKLSKISIYKVDCSQTCPSSDLERVIIYIYSIRKQFCLCSFRTLCYSNTLETLGQQEICHQKRGSFMENCPPTNRWATQGLAMCP